MKRRHFLLTGAGAIMALQGRALAQDKPKWDPDAGVTAPEDLMKEHGVLSRCLLIYEEGMRRIQASKPVHAEVFQRTAQLIHRFVEQYHEKNEETYIFPQFRKAKKLVSLVDLLQTQHEAGRRVTEQILNLSQPQSFTQNGTKLAFACQSFIRMYRPHKSREETVLFVALRTILPPEQVAQIGDQMEEQEKKVLGEGGFEHSVEQVAEIERGLGIFELAQFTPRKAG